jgi:hypothetical protein
MTMSKISAQKMRSARVFTINSDPSQIVLEVVGAADTQHYLLPIDELANFAKRLTQDAALLSAK